MLRDSVSMPMHNELHWYVRMWTKYIYSDSHVIWSLQRACSPGEGTSRIMSLEACLSKDVQKHGSRFGQKLDTTIAVTFLADP